MCGIAGFWMASLARTHEDIIRSMTMAIAHRGPDASGHWSEPDAGIVLGHRRLAIVDLTKEGAQPMASASGRYRVIYNGELYNFEELRRDLEGEFGPIVWRGHSDTEVLLAAIERWGIRASLERFNGMFAFALWDRADRRLTLARDRFGEKPLYYLSRPHLFAFASELKALRLLPEWRGEVDRGSLAALLAFDYVPAPRSIFKDVYKLCAGTFMSVSAPGASPQVHEYWSAAAVARAAVRRRVTVSDAEVVEELEGRLRRAVGLRMHADVPLGAFLSGGIDSTAVVAIMQSQSIRPVKTFSIGFEESAYDESKHAAAVARHLGTEHTTFVAKPADALAVVPLLPRIYDEPFADASQVPTFLVSRTAREYVTVALSGDGGDELFGGYNRHQWIPRVWRVAQRVPLAFRHLGAAAALALSPAHWDAVFGLLGRVSPRLRFRTPGDKLHKLALAAGSRSPREIYFRLATFWKDGGVAESDWVPSADDLPWDAELAPGEAAMLTDAMTYLPDDILVKVDRASMSVSLEARAPFLDPELFDFAWSLPPNTKVRQGQGKWALREVLYRHVPPELIDRPKSGFGIPIGAWLRGPLRDWAESLISEQRLREGGFFDAPKVRRVWQEHLQGRRNLEYHLWSVLMFEAWRDEYRVG